MKNEDAIKWLIKPTVTSTEVSPTKAKELEAYNMAVDALSTKDVQGEWVRKEKEINDCDGHRAFYWYECDQCGSKPPINQFTKQEWLSNFCPCCGAKMKQYKGGGDE